MRKFRSHGLWTRRRLLLSTLGMLVLSLGAAEQAPNPLIEQLKSPNADQRAKAASELGKKGESSAAPALVAALNDPSAKVRREVVVALAEIRGGESLDGLITASRDTDPQVRVVAVDALWATTWAGLQASGSSPASSTLPKAAQMRTYASTPAWL